MGEQDSFVVAVEAAVALDPTVGALYYPSARPDGEAVLGLGPDTTSMVTLALAAASCTFTRVMTAATKVPPEW